MRLHGTGWDFKTYCSAVKAVEEGKNPYFLKDLKEYGEGYLSFLYPPSSIILFKVFCFFDKKVSYHFLWLLLLIFSFFLIKLCDKNFNSFFLMTLLITGFTATYHNFRSGNVGLLELFFFSFVFLFLIKEKYSLFAIFLNITAWLKVIPILYGGLFIFLKTSRLKKLKTLSFLLIIFVFINFSSYVFYPKIISSYYFSVTGKIDNQNSPLNEIGDFSNPSSLFFFKELFSRLFGLNNLISFAFFILFLALVILLFFIIRGQRIGNLDLFSFGILSILLMLPRLKPYSFTLALLPIYFLTKDFDYKGKFWTITMASLLPLLLAMFSYFLKLFRLDSGFYDQILFLSSYRQLFCLFALFVYILKRVRRMRMICEENS